MSSLRLPRAAVGTILAAALSSCSSSPGLGPLWQPMDGALQCTPVLSAKVLTDGIEPIQNRATATAVIDTVALARAKGMRVITAYVVPDTASLYGVMPGYPPDGAFDQVWLAARADYPLMHWLAGQTTRAGHPSWSPLSADRSAYLGSVRLLHGRSLPWASGTSWYLVLRPVSLTARWLGSS